MDIEEHKYSTYLVRQRNFFAGCMGLAVLSTNSLRVLDFLNILILQNFFKSWVFSNHIRKIWNL